MKHKEDILRLRAEGRTYSEIVSLLGCSKGTVAYHCGIGQKEKTYNKVLAERKENRWLYRFRAKVHSFKNKVPCSDEIKVVEQKPLNVKIKEKYNTFCKGKPSMTELTSKNVFQLIEDAENKCSLTGRLLDLHDTASWNLDHIVPTSKGGDNTLENCQIVCKDANQAKSSLSTEELLILCKDILVHHKYKVEDPK